jgi:NAD(P)-dependent dehydrogenase (short-subunit alcohol dehydrogenase family)
MTDPAVRRIEAVAGHLYQHHQQQSRSAASTATASAAPPRLEGKVAVVTGGGTGIGEAIVKALHAEGCTVWVCGRRIEPLKAIVDACSSTSSTSTVLARSVDVADEAAVGALFAEVGRCDILVNNAGVNIVEREFSRLTPAAFKEVLDINTVGAFNCIHHAVEGAGGMAAAEDGLVVNVSSIAGMRTYELSGSAYTASKFAMNALGSAVASEYREKGIRVTNLCPGQVLTQILLNNPVQPSAVRLPAHPRHATPSRHRPSFRHGGRRGSAAAARAFRLFCGVRLSGAYGEHLAAAGCRRVRAARGVPPSTSEHSGAGHQADEAVLPRVT